MTGEHFWLALAGVLAWPAAVIVLVLIALAFALPGQRAAVLRALAEVVRAVRGAADSKPPASEDRAEEARSERSAARRPSR